MQIVHEALDALLNDKKLHSVTGFFPPLGDVKKKARFTRASNGNGIHLEIGRPNHREKKFLRLCKKAKTRPRKLWFSYFKED